MTFGKVTFFLLIGCFIMFLQSVLLAEENLVAGSSEGGCSSSRKEFDESFPMETLLGAKSSVGAQNAVVSTETESSDLEKYVENGFLKNDDVDIRFDDAEEHISTGTTNIESSELEGLIDNQEDKTELSENKATVENGN
ncbi:MAG: hypothetical protein HQM08_15790 [Candidatus Riflebacteria bacterium]|nr:hypothetical protein [Candidatus Riflebacteria bacterium]